MTSLTRLIGEDGPPLLNAAGTAKSLEHVRDLLDVSIGAILVGSYTMNERDGNDGQVYFATPSGSLNSVGIPSPNIKTWTGWVKQMQSMVAANGKTLWVSVAGFTPRECVVLAEAALEAGADAVEVNLGCPNIWHDGVQKQILSYSMTAVSEVLGGLVSLGAVDRVGVKLSPIFDTTLMDEIQSALNASSLAFVTAINTVPNCFALSDARPAISYEHGLAGMGGPAVKWIAQGQVRMHRAAMPHMPLVAVGGIESGCDLTEYLGPSLGASLCQVATAFLQKGKRVFAEILGDFADS